MKYFNTHTFFLILLVLLMGGCAHTRSGSYVFKNGKWVFIHSNVGIMNLSDTQGVGPENIDAGRFMWPVPSSKRISSKFGQRGQKHHDGMDIAAPIGSSIVACDDGKVVFSGRMRGYGKIVVVKHSGGYHTVYAHNQKNYVRKGQKVSKGEVIALVGNTGRSTGPHVHFEVRKDNRSRNPASYISVANRLADQ